MPANECIPLYEDADRVTVSVLAPVNGCRFVAPLENPVSGPGIPATAQVGASDPVDGANIQAGHCPPGQHPLGVSTWDALVPGEKVGCITEGIVPVLAGENLEPGEDVAVGPEGKAVKVAAEESEATLKTGVEANNNAILWRAVKAKTPFKIIIKVAGKETKFKLGVAGAVLTVTCATNNAEECITTAAEIIAAVNETAETNVLVTAANAGSSNGTGVVAAVAETESSKVFVEGKWCGLVCIGAASGNLAYIKLLL